MIITAEEKEKVWSVVCKYLDCDYDLREDTVQDVILDLLKVPTTLLTNRDAFIRTVARNVAIETLNSKTKGPWGTLWKTGKFGSQQIISLDYLLEQGFQITVEGNIPGGSQRYRSLGRKNFHIEAVY